MWIVAVAWDDADVRTYGIFTREDTAIRKAKEVQEKFVAKGTWYTNYIFSGTTAKGQRITIAVHAHNMVGE